MWTKPKTDWTANDFYNVEDYTRIRDNILWLKDLADNVLTFPAVITKSYTYDVPDLTPMANKTVHDLPYPSVLNAIENNFATINEYTHDLTDSRNTFVGNGTFITYTQLNDLESKIQLLHDWLLNDMAGASNLGFTLANDISQKGLRV